jgi:hypothetical protein
MLLAALFPWRNQLQQPYRSTTDTNHDSKAVNIGTISNGSDAAATFEGKSTIQTPIIASQAHSRILARA